MNQIIPIIPIITLLLSACSYNEPVVNPSQNDALNSISSSNADTHKGSMQKNIDSFFTNDWTPTVTQDEEIQNLM